VQQKNLKIAVVLIMVKVSFGICV